MERQTERQTARHADRMPRRGVPAPVSDALPEGDDSACLHPRPCLSNTRLIWGGPVEGAGRVLPETGPVSTAKYGQQMPRMVYLP